MCCSVYILKMQRGKNSNTDQTRPGKPQSPQAKQKWRQFPLQGPHSQQGCSHDKPQPIRFLSVVDQDGGLLEAWTKSNNLRWSWPECFITNAFSRIFRKCSISENQRIFSEVTVKAIRCKIGACEVKRAGVWELHTWNCIHWHLDGI